AELDRTLERQLRLPADRPRLLGPVPPGPKSHRERSLEQSLVAAPPLGQGVFRREQHRGRRDREQRGEEPPAPHVGPNGLPSASMRRISPKPRLRTPCSILARSPTTTQTSRSGWMVS